MWRYGCSTDQNLIAGAFMLQHKSSGMPFYIYLRKTSISSEHLRAENTFVLTVYSYCTVLTYLFTAERRSPKMEWAGVEWEGNAKKYGGAGAQRWAWVTEKSVSGEREFPPLPLHSHALLLLYNTWCTDTSAPRHFGIKTLRHRCRSVSDISTPITEVVMLVNGGIVT